MLTAITPLDRYIALTIVAAHGRRSIYEFVDSRIRPDASVQVFAFDDDYSFGILSSTMHRAWFDERCSRLETRPRYTPTTVWNTFPWPTPPTKIQMAMIARISAEILGLREEYRDQGLTLGQQYDALREPGRSEFRDAHDALDAAVFDAYGFASGDDTLAQLLALNLAAGSGLKWRRCLGGLNGQRPIPQRIGWRHTLFPRTSNRALKDVVHRCQGALSCGPTQIKPQGLLSGASSECHTFTARPRRPKQRTMQRRRCIAVYRMLAVVVRWSLRDRSEAVYARRGTQFTPSTGVQDTSARIS